MDFQKSIINWTISLETAYTSIPLSLAIKLCWKLDHFMVLAKMILFEIKTSWLVSDFIYAIEVSNSKR